MEYGEEAQGDRKMARQSWLLVLNLALFLMILMQLITGIRLWLVTLWGWADFNALMSFHLINGLSLATLIAVHLYMNRRWIKIQIMGPARKRQ